MSPGKERIIVLLITTLNVVILQAAPTETTSAASPSATTEATATESTVPLTDSSTVKPPKGDLPTDKPPTNAANLGTKPAGTKPTNPKPLKKPTVPLTDSSTVKPSKGDSPTDKPPTNAANLGTKPAGTKPTSPKPLKPSPGDHGNSWSCLVQVVEEWCSYLTDWTSLKKIPALDWFSFFHEKSSEESDEDSSSSLFRFKRSVEDSPVAQEAFLDLLDGFYVKSRERFVRENPGLVSTSLDNLYDKSDEIAQVVAYVLGVPKETLAQVFEKMKTRHTGTILLKALGERRNVSSGKHGLANNKTINGLTPTSISYFFQELLGSINGITTGFSELVNIGLQSQNITAKPIQIN